MRVSHNYFGYLPLARCESASERVGRVTRGKACFVNAHHRWLFPLCPRTLQAVCYRTSRLPPRMRRRRRDHRGATSSLENETFARAALPQPRSTATVLGVRRCSWCAVGGGRQAGPGETAGLRIGLDPCLPRDRVILRSVRPRSYVSSTLASALARRNLADVPLLSTCFADTSLLRVEESARRGVSASPDTGGGGGHTQAGAPLPLPEPRLIPTIQL
jgi:hypothetical protein